MSSYPGSPALAFDAREKVLQTFRHTLELVQEGKNEEALIGCDFLLKMDARFAPARSLLEMLRGAPPGARVNVEEFSEHFAVESAGEALPDGGHKLPDAFPGGPADPPPSAAPPAGLDDLVFGDDAAGAAGHRLPEAPPSEAALEPAPPSPPADDPFGGGLDDLRLSLPVGGAGAMGAIPAPSTAPPLASAAAGEPPQMPPLAAASSRAVTGTQVDARIAQFLKQGDEALSRGSTQEAIDLWSRVFLIDLSNEEASRRIDAAREAQAEAGRRIDLLLSEGVSKFEAGDLAGARNKFLDVLAVSENDATARGYLNQIEVALAPPRERSGPQAGGAGSAGDSEFMRHEIEAPGPPSFAVDSGVRRRSPESAADLELALADSRGEAPPARGRGRIDVRVLLGAAVFLLAAVASGTYWFLRVRPASRPENAGASPVKGGGPSVPRAPGEDAFQKAQALFDAGRIDEAIFVLAKLPESDPRHTEALVRIEKMKSSAAPTPGPAAPSAAALDEMRIAGFAAMSSSRYIDALKNLDPVLKARPQDAEAAAAAQRAHEQVEALRSASKSYNEADYDSAIKLLWELRKGDPKNQDVEEYLVNAYYNAAVQSFQAGNIPKAMIAVKEATDIRPGDAEAQRLLRFARKYPRGATDLLSRILIKHLSVRP